MGNKSIPELSIDSRLLFERLDKVPIGGFISYDELSDTIGRKVQGTGNLYTALRIIRRESGKVFAPVRGKGLKCLKDDEIVNTSGSFISRIHNISRKGQKTLTAVQDFDSLPNESKVKHNAALSVLGVLNVITRPSKVRKIENKVGEAQEKLPLVKTLEAFM